MENGVLTEIKLDAIKAPNLNDDELLCIDNEVSTLIECYRNNRQEINRLTFECVASISAGEEYSEQLATKKGLRRFLGVFTGSNKKVQDIVNKNQSAAQYASQVMLMKLAEQNLMSFELIAAVNNRLNSCINDIEGEINEIYSKMIMFFKKSSSRIIQIENRLDRIEININLLNWLNTIEYQTFNNIEYRDLDNYAKIVCLARDFYDITKAEWNTSDLLLLKSAMSKVGISSSDTVSYYDFIKQLYFRAELREYLFNAANLVSLPEPECYPLYCGVKKMSLYDNEDSYVVDTMLESFNESNIVADRNSVITMLSKKFLSNESGITEKSIVHTYDLLLEILFGYRQLVAENVIEEIRMEEDKKQTDSNTNDESVDNQVENDITSNESTETDISGDADEVEYICDDPIEEYVGIPLEIAEQIYPICLSNYSNDINDISFFESKNYFVWYYDTDYDLFTRTTSYKFKRYNKTTATLDDVSLPLADDRTFKKDPGYYGFVEGNEYAVDYNRDLVYYIADHNVYKYDIEKNSYEKIDGLKITGNFRSDSIRICNKLIVIISNNEAVYYDTIHGKAITLVDCTGKNIKSDYRRCVVGDEKIIFIPNNAEELSASDGGSLTDSVCLYDIKTHEISRILDTSKMEYIKSMISVHDKIYFILDRGSLQDGFVIKELCECSDNQFVLETVLEHKNDCHMLLYNHFLTYYENYGKKSSYCIYAFDFIAKEAEKVVSDCYMRKNTGVFKANWERTKSTYTMLGQWIYYIRGHIPAKSYDPCIPHICRANFEVPLKSVDLGDKNKLVKS